MIRTGAELSQVVQCVITTFGSLHGEPPASGAAVLLLDLRKALRNPFEDPAMRELTGLDPVVSKHVLETEGADQIVTDTIARVRALLAYTDRSSFRADLQVMCKGGRHRSVAVAEEIAHRLRAAGIGVECDHLDVDKPVVIKQS